MRYLLYTAFALAACGRADSARDAQPGGGAQSAPPAEPAMSAATDRLLGSWTAQGYDAGSKKAQRFTITWDRAPDGSLVGTIAFRPGETYKVKVISTGDSTFIYESEPHHSPTLKGKVVTRTHARLVGDSLTGTYEARAIKGGKTLQGHFVAKRGS
jgi:hypothetical protein